MLSLAASLEFTEAKLCISAHLLFNFNGFLSSLKEGYQACKLGRIDMEQTRVVAGSELGLCPVSVLLYIGSIYQIKKM